MPAKSVLMVRPHGFRSNSETAADNAFQAKEIDEDLSAIQSRAGQEFEGVAKALIDSGIGVVAIEGHPDHPDDIFPNNWFSTFEDGSLILYPMKAVSRRTERRPEFIDLLLARYPQLVDLSGWEDRHEFLEGTGSLVLDHDNRIAFAARSERTYEALVRNWCADFEFEPVIFDTMGPGGKPVYHTNVMLSLGSGYAIVCTECIEQPTHVLSALLATGRDIIEITKGQMSNFCANALEVEGEGKLLVVSETAKSAFSHSQLEVLQRHVKLLACRIPTIEKYGGGGIRCMLAELF